MNIKKKKKNFFMKFSQLSKLMLKVKMEMIKKKKATIIKILKVKITIRKKTQINKKLK